MMGPNPPRSPQLLSRQGPAGSVGSTSNNSVGKTEQGQLQPSSSFRPRSSAPVRGTPSGALGQRPGEDPGPATSTALWLPAGLSEAQAFRQPGSWPPRPAAPARMLGPVADPDFLASGLARPGPGRKFTAAAPQMAVAPRHPQEPHPQAAARGASCVRRTDWEPGPGGPKGPGDSA